MCTQTSTWRDFTMSILIEFREGTQAVQLFVILKMF